MSRESNLPILVLNGQSFSVEESRLEGAFHIVSVDGREVSIEVLKELGVDPLEILVKVENKILRLAVDDAIEDSLSVRLNGRRFKASLQLFHDHATVLRKEQNEGPVVVTAPMSGRIASLKVNVGSVTEEGQSLVILEAMKMENEIASPRKGTVREVYVQTGTLVKAGDKLALVE